MAAIHGRSHALEQMAWALHRSESHVKVVKLWRRVGEIEVILSAKSVSLTRAPWAPSLIALVWAYITDNQLNFASENSIARPNRARIRLLAEEATLRTAEATHGGSTRAMPTAHPCLATPAAAAKLRKETLHRLS